MKIFNTNTQSSLVETIQVDSDGHFLEDGDYRISGVKGTSSSIKVSFLNPGGSMTGKIFPTGRPCDEFLVQANSLADPFMVRATLIDVSNPFIFVGGSTLPPAYYAAGPDSDISLEIIESIRRQGAVHYGLASDTENAALQRGTPKIAIVSKPLTVVSEYATVPDISVLAYSMGKVHPSVQLTGAVCLGAAACLQGTVVSELMASSVLPSTQASQTNRNGRPAYNITLGQPVGDDNFRVVIGHSSGTIDVEVNVSDDNQIESVTVFRTAHRIFEGTILVPIEG